MHMCAPGGKKTEKGTQESRPYDRILGVGLDAGAAYVHVKRVEKRKNSFEKILPNPN